MEFSAKNNYNKIYVKILTYFQNVSDSGDVMALRKINWNDPLMRAIKAFNSIGGNSLTKEDLKRQRSAMDRAGKLAATAVVDSMKALDILFEQNTAVVDSMKGIDEQIRNTNDSVQNIAESSKLITLCLAYLLIHLLDD